LVESKYAYVPENILLQKSTAANCFLRSTEDNFAVLSQFARLSDRRSLFTIFTPVFALAYPISVVCHAGKLNSLT